MNEYIQLFTHIIFPILLFLPLFGSGAFLGNDFLSITVCPALSSALFGQAVIANISITLLRLVDLGIECVNTTDSRSIRLIWRCIIFLSSALHDLLLLTYIIPNCDMKLFWIIWHVREFWFVCSMLELLRDVHDPNWSDRLCLVLSFIFGVAQLLRELSAHFFNVNSAMGIVATILYIFIGAFLAYKLVVLCTSRQIDSCRISVIMYSSSLISFVIGTFIMVAIFGPIPVSSMDSYFLVSYEAFASSSTIILSLFFTRASTVEFVALQMKLDQKKNFFRYMTHELRTPLNTMMMGLSFYSQRLGERENFNEVVYIRAMLC